MNQTELAPVRTNFIVGLPYKILNEVGLVVVPLLLADGRTWM